MSASHSSVSAVADAPDHPPRGKHGDAQIPAPNTTQSLKIASLPCTEGNAAAAALKYAGRPRRGARRSARAPRGGTQAAGAGGGSRLSNAGCPGYASPNSSALSRPGRARCAALPGAAASSPPTAYVTRLYSRIFSFIPSRRIPAVPSH